MRAICLRLTSLCFGMLCILGCSTRLRSLRHDKIPVAVAQYFSALALDSVNVLAPQSFRYETDTYVSVFTLEAAVVQERVKGRLYEKRFSKELPHSPLEGVSQKPLELLLKYKICCSNHTPNDCVSSKSKAVATARTRGCRGWRLIIL